MARSKKDGRRGGGHHHFGSGMNLKEVALKNGKAGGWGETWSPEVRKFLKRQVSRGHRRLSKKGTRLFKIQKNLKISSRLSSVFHTILFLSSAGC